jgi:hypothetical protein
MNIACVQKAGFGCIDTKGSLMFRGMLGIKVLEFSGLHIVTIQVCDFGVWIGEWIY